MGLIITNFNELKFYVFRDWQIEHNKDTVEYFWIYASERNANLSKFDRNEFLKALENYKFHKKLMEVIE